MDTNSSQYRKEDCLVQNLFVHLNYFPEPDRKKLLALTRRETQVLILAVKLLTYERIAKELCISPLTVRNHMRNIIDKLGVASKMQVIIWCYQIGLEKYV